MEEHATNGKASGVKPYIIAWLALLALTALTVTAAEFRAQHLAVVICLAIASVKAVVVFLYFMHLRHEPRVVIRILVPVSVVLLAIFIGLTYTDIILR
ncbi:MAG: cytochrome C oxidase subunit IV family protein [Spirochaetes bacterium]|nr:cytochrome C oxidase subunit IV family protein [Spirochaetota bacterium]